MSRIASILVLFTASLTGTLFSQAKPKLAAFASLLANPKPYLGQTIALHGIIDKSDEAAGGFKLTETKSSGEKTSFLRATWIKGGLSGPTAERPRGSRDRPNSNTGQCPNLSNR